MWATSRSELTSYRARTSSGSDSRRTKWVGTITVVSTRWVSIARSTFSASKRPSTTTGMPAASRRTPDSGPVWYIGPTTRWVPKAANALCASAATCSVIVPPPANIVGGSSTPLGRPVVPDVYIRFGSRLDVGRRLGRRRRGQPVLPRPHVGLRPSSRQPMTTGTPDPPGGVEPGRRRPRTDEQHPGAGVLEDVRHLVGVEVEVDRHRRGAGEQPAEVGEHRLDAVLGEHGDPAVGAEVEVAEAVDDPVEDVVDLGPAERHVVVAQRHLVRAFDGECRGDERPSVVPVPPAHAERRRSSTRSARPRPRRRPAPVRT